MLSNDLCTYVYAACAVHVTTFSTGGKFRPVSNFMKAFTLAVRSYALWSPIWNMGLYYKLCFCRLPGRRKWVVPLSLFALVWFNLQREDNILHTTYSIAGKFSPVRPF